MQQELTGSTIAIVHGCKRGNLLLTLLPYTCAQTRYYIYGLYYGCIHRQLNTVQPADSQLRCQADLTCAETCITHYITCLFMQRIHAASRLLQC